MKKLKFFIISMVMVVALSLAVVSYSVTAGPLGASAPGLGAAGNFSVLGFSEVTNSGPTKINRSIGVWSGTSISGLAQITVGGAVHQTDSVAQQAQADANTAVGNISGQANTGGTLGALDGLTLSPGVYDMGAGSLGGGTLTLKGEGVYLFRTSSDLTSSGSVDLIGGARACDVYWFVATQANLTGGSFAGTIIAGSGIVFGTGVSLNGRALAIGGPVTLLSNTITGPSCPSAAPAATGTATIAAVSGLPSSGGAPIQNQNFPWIWIIIGSFGAIALLFGVLTYRRSSQS